MHARDIVSNRRDGRDASFIRVRDLIVARFQEIICFYALLNSTSNSSIETGAIKTVPKISRSKRSSGSFCTS